MFKSIRDNVSLLTVIILMVGLVNTIIYYQFFNLPIKYFVSLSELGIIFSDNLLYTLGFGAAYICCVYILLTSRDQEKTSPTPKLDSFYQRKYEIIMLVFCWGIGIGLVYRIIRLIVVYDYVRMVGTVILFILFLAVLLLRRFIKNGQYVKYTTKYLNDVPIIFFILIVAVFPPFVTIKDIKNTNKGKFKGTYIKTPTKEHISNDSSFFIGKTERYIFIYNKKDESTDVIPTDDIIEFKLKSK